MSYYLDLSSDIYVTYLYSQSPDIYQSSWVVLSAIFLSLPTCTSPTAQQLQQLPILRFDCFTVLTPPPAS